MPPINEHRIPQNRPEDAFVRQDWESASCSDKFIDYSELSPLNIFGESYSSRMLYSASDPTALLGSPEGPHHQPSAATLLDAGTYSASLP